MVPPIARGSEAKLSFTGVLAGMELCPRPGNHVAQCRSFPGVLRMSGEERLGVEIRTAGMAHVRDQAHLLRHLAVRYFPLHGAAGIMRAPGPDGNSASIHIGVAAERALVGAVALGVGIEMIAFEFFRQLHINLSFVL